MVSGLYVELGEFLETLSEGRIPEMDRTTGYMGALRVCIPPYPDEDCKDSEGQPVQGIENDERIFPLDVKREEGRLLSSGYDGIICEVTGVNDDLETLWSKIYKVSHDLQIPNKMFRTDALENAKERIESLGVYNDIL
jgi:phosphoribosylamine--glycine ligase